MERVAVIIPVHNGEKFLELTLKSVLAQTFAGFHLYLVDDGSTDHTREICQAYAQDSRITVLHQTNAGQATAINRALRAGQEPMVAVCDADDLWREDRLATALAALDADSHLGFTCNDYCSGSEPAAPWVSAWQTRNLEPASGEVFGRLLKNNFVQRSAVLIRREQLERHHGFSEAIGGKCGCDDWDMWLKIARSRPIHCIHEVMTFKRSWNGQESRSIQFLESQVRLWESWVHELRTEPKAHFRQARRNLGQAYFELGYNRLKKEGKTMKTYSELLRAAQHGHRPVRALCLVGGSMFGLV